MLKLEKVNKYFNRHKKNQIHVINNTSLEFPESGLIALLGESGCGKTTLLNAIGGLDKINNGKIILNNKKLPKRNSNRKDKMRVLNIGYIFQDYNLLENLTVYENIELSLKMIGIKSKKEIKSRIDYVLEKVDMYRYRNKPAGMLSGGEKQRVGIARAIVKNPSIIIADEPTGNLDSKNTIEIMNIIKAISNDKLVILVTHEKDLAHFYASRIINLEDGRVVGDNDNTHENELDYRIDNRLYLKDFKNHDKLSDKNHKINLYSDDDDKLDLDIVIKNNNIYIRSKKQSKLEIVDENSSIELIDAHYKKISKEENIDYVIECIGLKETMEQAIHIAGKNAKVLLFGLGDPKQPIQFNQFEAYTKELSIYTSYLNPQTTNRAVRMLESGLINTKDIISAELSLEEMGDELKNHTYSRQGKVMVYLSRKL